MPLEITDHRRFLRALAGCTLAVVLLVAGSVGAAMAGDDDDDDDTFDTKFMKSILGSLGLKNENSTGIDYHERSPLVVPPTRDLPPPETTGATSASNNPAWPKDADLERRSASKKKKAKLPSVVDLDQDMRQLRPDEMKNGRPVTASPLPTQTYSETANPALKPWDLGFKGFSFGSVFSRDKEESVPFTGEPPRVSLTEPPVGLRTPSPSQPYGTKGGLEADKSAGDDRHELGPNR